MSHNILKNENLEQKFQISDLQKRTDALDELIASEKIKIEKKINILKNAQGDHADSIRTLEVKLSKLPRTPIYPVSNNYSKEIVKLKQQVKENTKRLNNIKEQTRVEINENIITDIIEMQYSPCSNGLKNNAYCHTLGTMINKLGGQFIDPMSFKREEKDFLKYMSLSNIKL